MQVFPVLYAVWPSPLRVSRTPESSWWARSTAQWYGVAGSRVVPITTIGAAPRARMSGTFSSLRGVNPWHDVRLHANTLPHTGDAFSNAADWPGIFESGSDQWSSRQEMSKNASIELSLNVPSALRAA